MTSQRQIQANRRNSRNSLGPRSAAGKSIASRNALRHGLAALTHQQQPPSAQIERYAKALCGDDKDPQLFRQAIKIAENEIVLSTIRAQQVAVVERLRDGCAPFAKKDNSLDLARRRSLQSERAHQALVERVPAVLEKYKNELPPDLKAPDSYYDETVMMNLEALLQEPDHIDDSILEAARAQIDERDEYQALQAAIVDLIRLDRYERRAWSRQKRAIRDFLKIQLYRQMKSRLRQ